MPTYSQILLLHKTPSFFWGERAKKLDAVRIMISILIGIVVEHPFRRPDSGLKSRPMTGRRPGLDFKKIWQVRLRPCKA
ncbi:hypothetical protein MTR_4g061500 [Medicago truncatula]|uniref:Uncharacterized protein n=1 Tax=Medicago truncatula TaxID=3880 RepID=G7JRL2_MEDTR|nr:hypothetical protein MTR_4g061500 [Medicago truncatula]